MAKEKTYNKIVVVDEYDNIIGAEMMLDAIEKGLIRSASRVYVFSESGKVLIQRRSKNVLKPLLLDQSAAGHVDEGETRLEAGLRELEEETGIKGRELTLIADSFPSPGFFNAVYKVVVPDNIALIPEEEEIDELMWLSVSELDTLVASESDKCTPSLIDSWQQLRDKLIYT